MRGFTQLFVGLGLVVCSGCSESSQTPLDATPPPPDVAAGRLAFEENCSSCHASRDGFDVKAFGFADTTIVRRAVKHVDSATARNIVAYIQSVPAPSHPKELRLFQPGGAPLPGDVEFAIALFGADAWPANLTTAQLAAIEPRSVKVAVKLPTWSNESSNTDWMPDFPLPPGILDYSGGLVAGAIAGYQAVPTQDNLLRAVNALRSADRAMSNAAAPCLLDDTTRVRYRDCFEVRRWTSTLVAVHMLRHGMNANLGGFAHDIWWDVGNAARKSRADPTAPVANAVENWTTWMFLGWMFDPARHTSFYTGAGFRQMGLNRHATFIALRTQVARPRNHVNVYEDYLNAVRFSPSSWTLSVARFALRHLGERISAGERPVTAEQVAMATTWMRQAMTEANRKVSTADRPTLDALALPILAALAQ